MGDTDDAQNKKTAADLSSMLGIDGLLNGMTNILGKFSELAEKGESLQRAQSETDSGKKVMTSYGFSVKFGPGNGGEQTVEPIAKPTAAKPTPKPVSTPQKREPHVEVFDESDHVLVIAEMPGVSSEDVSLGFNETKLMICGKSKTAEFQREMDLPAVFGPEQVSITANNGVIEIRMTK